MALDNFWLTVYLVVSDDIQFVHTLSQRKLCCTSVYHVDADSNEEKSGGQEHQSIPHITNPPHGIQQTPPKRKNRKKYRKVRENTPVKPIHNPIHKKEPKKPFPRTGGEGGLTPSADENTAIHRKEHENCSSPIPFQSKTPAIPDKNVVQIQRIPRDQGTNCPKGV